MKKNILSIGIIIQFIISALIPITIGYKSTKSDYKIINENDLKYLLNNQFNSEWPKYQHDAANTGFSEELFPDNFNQLWFKSYQDDLNISMISICASPVTFNRKIFITGDKTEHDDRKYGIICALNQSDGGLIWKKELPLNKNAFMGLHSFHSPAVYEGKIFTVVGCFFSAFSKSKIVALDENTGDILWEKSFFGIPYYSSVTVADGKVFVCGHLTFFPISWLYAFDVNNGEMVWRKKFSGYVEITPVIYENKIFITSGKISSLKLSSFMIFPLYSGKSKVYAINIDDGEEIWMKKIFGHLVQCSPSAANGILFVPSNIMILNRKWICRISAFDVETGEKIWYHDMNQEKGAMWPSSISTPSVAYNKVFVTDSDGWLRAWYQNSGDLVWEKEIFPGDPDAISDAFASPIVIDGKVIVGANANHSLFYNELFMFNESTGEYIWNLKFEGETVAAPFIVSNEMLFVNDGFKGIYAFG